MRTSPNAKRALAAATFAFTLALGSTADAYVVKHAASGAVVRWNRPEITLVLSPTLDHAGPGARDAVRRAAQAWSALTPHSPTIHVVDGADGDAPAYDGKNVVYFAEHGYAAAGKALAVTILSFDSESGAIVDSDIVLSGAHALEVLADDARGEDGARAVSTEGGGDDLDGSQKFDLVHVLAHETGHALGLGDDANASSALMFPFTVPGDATMRAPRSDDTAGLAAIYAAPAGGASAQSAGSPSHASCAVGNRSSGASGALAAALAIVALFIRRKEGT